MRLHPVKASGWFNVGLSEAERQLLINSGVVPTNDVFYPIWFDNSQIKLLRGGRGGGKSEITCDKLLQDALIEPYAKIYYGRKVFDNVRGSCFATLVAAVKKNNLERYFHYSGANTSSMILTCKLNGNQLIPFGSDKADKLKSIKDPTHIWCEEFDQFTFEDFMELFPTLRTIRGKNEFWGTFNAYAVHEEHWVLKTFFPEHYNGVATNGEATLQGISICKILANYYDNYFIDREDYEKKLRLACSGNDMLFQGLANGAWGVTDNTNPWLYNFDYEKHVKDLPFLPAYDVYLSFDFNNDPFACTAWQMSPVKGDPRHSFLHCIKEFTGVMKVEEMCARIKTTFPGSILHVTGDRSGSNEDIGRNQTLYQTIAALLNLGAKQLDLNTHNLEHADSRMLFNTMLYHYPNFFIDRSCKNFIRQCQQARVDVDSNKPSQLLKNREDHKNDEFDSGRYLLQTYFNKFVKETYLKIVRK